jgi:hypothetical protein
MFVANNHTAAAAAVAGGSFCCRIGQLQEIFVPAWALVFAGLAGGGIIVFHYVSSLLIFSK